MERLTVGMLATQCYLVPGDLDPRSVLVIDPGGDGEKILSALDGRLVRAVLLTHGHFDHTGALDLFGDCPVYLGASDAPMLRNPTLSAGFLTGDRSTHLCEPRLLHGGEALRFEGFSVPVQVLACPGHTPGGVTYRIGQRLFCGDTLFFRGYGRTDLPGGDEAALFRSIRTLLTLEADAEVFPGHGEKTTLAAERRFWGLPWPSESPV